MLSERGYLRRPPDYREKPGYYAVPTLILINVLVFILQTLSEAPAIVYQNGVPCKITVDISQYMSLSLPKVLHGEIWRPFTYMFAHAGLLHLVLNMWGVYLFGGMLESYMGSARFLRLYFISGLVGAAAYLSVNWVYPCVGASAALFGVMVAAALMFPNATLMLLFPPVPLKLRTFVLIYAGLEIMLTVSTPRDGVAHIAHLGGLIGGYIYMLSVYKGQCFNIFSFLFGGLSGRHRAAPSGWKFTNGTTVSANEIDRLLDKISHSGVNSLSEEELEKLRRARDEMRR